MVLRDCRAGRRCRWTQFLSIGIPQMPHNAFWDRFAGQVNVTGIFPPPQNGNYSKVYGDGIRAIIPRIARRRKKQPAVKQPVVNFSSGGRTRTSGLRVMSPTSYQLLYPAMFWFCKDTHYFFQNKFFWKIWKNNPHFSLKRMQSGGGRR